MEEKSDRVLNGRLIFIELILIGVIVWVVDSILDFFFFYEGHSFWDLFILDIPTHELYIRSFIIILLFLVAVLILKQFNKQEKKFQSRLKIKKELLQSQKKLTTIFQAIPDIFFLFSREGTCLEYKGHTYVNPDIYLGKNLQNFMPKEVSQKMMIGVEELFKTKQSQIIQYSLQMPNGELTFFHSQLLYYSEDKFASFSRDITKYVLDEQKLIKSEHSLRERNKELHSLYKISQLQDDPILSVENLFKRSVEIISQAFELPETIGARISFKDSTYSSENFNESDSNFFENIEIDRDFLQISISYPEGSQILKEEENFLKSIMQRFKIVIENKNSEEIRGDFRRKLEKEVEAKTLQLIVASNQLMTIWENIADPIFVISDDYKILFSNLSAQKLLGETLIGSLCYESIKGCTKPCESCLFYPIGQKNKNFKPVFEQMLINPQTNESLIFEIAISEIENFQGQHAMLEILRNVTDRKKIEDKLKESESVLQARVTELDCLYEISSLLSQPNISIPKILHGSIPLILSLWLVPEKPHVKVAYGGFEFKTDNYSETIWRLSTSDYIDEKPLTIDVFCQDENTLNVENINGLREVVDRLSLGISNKEAEIKKNTYVSIVRDSNDAIIGLDLDGAITSWNKSAEVIFGYTSEEIFNKTNRPLVPPDNNEEVTFIINEISKGNHIDHFETKRIRKDGKLLDISLTASPIKNAQDKIIGLSVISRDFTEINEQNFLYQAQILKSSQFKSEFMASMSHELRTPLNSIIGFSDILLEKFYGELNENQSQYVGNVRTSADHLLNLINNILDISKIEAGKMELDIQENNLSKIINAVEITLRSGLKKKNLHFEVIGMDAIKKIYADPVRLQEILINLLNNAIKYTKEGNIILEIVDTPSLWTFHVQDTGIGIKPEDSKLIFKEFQRIKSDYTATVEGTGLGLALTKKLVELHGGNISFKSIFGKGSTFSFTLPKTIN